MKNPNGHKFRTDIVLFLLIFLLCLHKVTGDVIHEWLGVVIVLPLLWHLCLNWNWLTAVLRRFFSKQTFTVRFNLIWDILLYMSIGITIFSGILISRSFLSLFGISIENDAFMSYIHHNLTKLLFIMIGIHLGMHWDWIRARLSNIFTSNNYSSNSLSSNSHSSAIESEQGVQTTNQSTVEEKI